jgi:hypothetical protein
MGSKKPQHSTRSRGRSRPTSRSRKPPRKRTRRPSGKLSRKGSPRIPAPVLEHIEGVVGRLWRASALLNTAEIATNYADDAVQVLGDTWHVVQIVGELIAQAIDALDSVSLEAANKAGAEGAV